MKVYVASSWRNNRQPVVVQSLRDAGHEVYDFKQPVSGDNGFHWTEIDGGWKTWTPETFVAALDHPIAQAGYRKDMDALEQSEVCVMVMPCGRSASLETGYAVGAGKPTFILLSDGEPELMFKMAQVCLTLPELIERVNNCCHYETKSGLLVPRVERCPHRNLCVGKVATLTGVSACALLRGHEGPCSITETMPGGMF